VPRAAVLGSPIGHSLSPVLHRAAYAAMGLTDWTYEAHECADDGLAGFLDGLGPDWAGLSLTMPLKRVALKLADEVTDLAQAVGGANTIVLRDGRRLADNTDVYGMATALTEAGLDARPAAVILGAGATAASTLAALRNLGRSHAVLAVRDPARAQETQAAGQRLGVTVQVIGLTVLPEALTPDTLVISTLPGDAAAPHAPHIAGSGAAVFDVVYAPWPTPLAAEVQATGGTATGGFPMLVHQAVAQVRLMTGHPNVPVEALRTAGEAELTRRATSTTP
jgi:shikimate dehydrogenase